MKRITTFLSLLLLAVFGTTAYAQETVKALDTENPLEWPAEVIETPGDYFYSQWTTNDEQTIPEQGVYYFLVDGDASTYWHSAWENGNVAQDVHYLQVNLPEDFMSDNNLTEGFGFGFMRRSSAANDHLVKAGIYAVPDELLSSQDQLAISDLVFLQSDSLPYTSNSETVWTNIINPVKDGVTYHVFRIYSEAEYGSAVLNRGYWHTAELYVAGTQDVDARAASIQTLSTTYNTYAEDPGTFEENVGESYGNYHESDVTAFSEAMAAAEEILGAWDEESYEGTVADIEAANKAITDTRAAVLANVVPYNYTELADGYYVVKNCLDFTTSENVYYTQEEADALNAESGAVEGDDNYVTTSDVKETVTNHVAKAMYDNSGAAAWKSYGQGGVQFLWKLEKAADGKNYKMTNMLGGRTFAAIAQSSAVSLAVSDTLVAIDWAQDPVEVYPEGVDGEVEPVEVQPLNIRLSGAAARGYLYAHAGGHGGGAGVSGNIVGWSTSAAGEIGATMWYFEQIDNATAEEWMATDYTKAIKYIAYCDSVQNTVPAQITIAKDVAAEIDETKQAASVETFTSPWTETTEGSIEGAFDNDASTFWHAAWSSTSSGHAVSAVDGTNYFVVNDVDNMLNGGLAIRITRRQCASDHPTSFKVYGTDEYDATQDTGEGYDGLEWTELGTLSTPFGSNTETITSNAISYDGGYNYYKFVCTGTTNSRGYFHFAEFRVFSAKVGTKYPTTQYSVRKEQADAVEAALETYAAGNFNADSIAAGKQNLADLAAAYNSVKAAAEAWGAVYVDPANLRTAISTAQTTADNIVIGNNPGEWKASSKAAAFKTTVAEAQAYDEAGAYTPAKVAEYIETLNNGVESAISEANGITANTKWYYIHFAPEALYTEKGWDKTGAQAKETSTGNETDPIQTAPALFGRYVTVAKHDYHYRSFDYADEDTSYTDTVAVYDTEIIPASKAVIGTNVKFADRDESGREAGMNYWRFVAYNDSLYVIQNQGTGLYMKISGSTGQVTVSPNASFFKDPVAMGAGAVLIPAYNIEGTACNYLHGECATSKLVTWGATTLGCNSMMFIEEAEDVTTAPTTTATISLWPGDYSANTYMTSMKFDDTVKAYGKASVDKNDFTVNVTLNQVENNTLLAGQPCLLMLPTDTYMTWDEAYTADSLAYVQENGDPELGFDHDYFAQKAVSDMVAKRYQTASVTLGTEFTTHVLNDYSDLKGTFTSASLGRGVIMPQDNVLKTATMSTTCAAFGAYIDATSIVTTIADAQLPVAISEGEVTGINGVNADEVAPATSGIYNIAGQKLNKVQKGLNIVNGKKVVY